MIIKRGFVLYDEGKDTFKVDTKASTSLIVNELLLTEIIKTRVFAKGYFLDIGCGLEPYREVFSKRITKYIGIDWPSSMHENKGLVDLFADNRALPFKDECFDTILCTEVLEHSPSPLLVIKEIKRVLRKDGSLILTTPFMYLIHDEPWDYFRFTRFGLENIAKDAGLTVEFIKPVGGFFSVMADFVSKLMLYIFPVWIAVIYQKSFLFLRCNVHKMLDKHNSKGVCHLFKLLIDSLGKRFSIGHIMVARKL